LIVTFTCVSPYLSVSTEPVTVVLAGAADAADEDDADGVVVVEVEVEPSALEVPAAEVESLVSVDVEPSSEDTGRGLKSSTPAVPMTVAVMTIGARRMRGTSLEGE
jgi:hypothetical protein